MKKILSLILAVAMMLLLVACGGEVGEEGDVSLVVENRDGSYDVYKVYLEDVTNKEEGVYGVVEFIMQREENPITADIVDSSYGAYVNSIGSLTPDASKNEYVCLYTSLEKDFGIAVDKRKLELPDVIKSYGTYSVTVKLYTDIVGKFTVVVHE